MEKVITSSTQVVDEKTRELKIFKKAFIIFFISEILLIISTVSNATIINGVPRWLDVFEIFLYISFILMLFSVFPLRRFNDSFRKSLYSLLALYIVTMFFLVCETSNEQFYVSISRGLDWSIDIVKCIFYLFYFHGCVLFFDKYNLHAGKKKTIILLIVFLVLFIANELFDYLSTSSLVRRNRFFNRFFLYGTWGFSFASYVFTFVMIIIFASFLNKHFKKEKENKDEIQNVSE